MLEVYSINKEVGDNSAIPFDNVSIKKGCTSELSGTSTIALNRCGVYMVAFNATAGTSTTVQLYKDGVAQEQAQATGTSLAFVTLVRVGENNTNCPCASPVNLQFMNETTNTFTNVNVVVTKIV